MRKFHSPQRLGFILIFMQALVRFSSLNAWAPHPSIYEAKGTLAITPEWMGGRCDDNTNSTNESSEMSNVFYSDSKSYTTTSCIVKYTAKFSGAMLL